MNEKISITLKAINSRLPNSHDKLPPDETGAAKNSLQF